MGDLDPVLGYVGLKRLHHLQLVLISLLLVLDFLKVFLYCLLDLIDTVDSRWNHFDRLGLLVLSDYRSWLIHLGAAASDLGFLESEDLGFRLL